MEKSEVLKRIKELGMLAVIRGPSEALTIKIIDALVEGGVLGIEVTFSTPNAYSVVKKVNEKYGNRILLGMGTLTFPEQAESAKAVGAKFLVSPICSEFLVKAMVDSGLLTMAGALTPTEVFQAYKLGSDVVKVFPGSLTGPSYIKALKGPFSEIPLMPTGGVSISNLRDWFEAGVIAVGVGSELCPTQLAKDGRFNEITERAREFTKLIREIQIENK